MNPNESHEEENTGSPSSTSEAAGVLPPVPMEKEEMESENEEGVSSPPAEAPKGEAGAQPAPAPAVARPAKPPAPKKAGSTVAKNKSGDKPRRPLSAYNYFFREQRVEMLQERDEKLRKARAEGTKTDDGEYGFFGTMAKVIAKRWKEISPDALQEYKKKAELDSKRYRQEMEDYNKRKTLLPKKQLDSPKKKKGKKPLKGASLKKEKGGSGMTGISLKLGSKSSGTSVSSLPLAAPKDLSPSMLSMPIPTMTRFAQGPASSDLALGGGVFPRAVLQQQPSLLQQQQQQQYLGQLDLETQIALLNAQQQQQLQFQQQQRSLDSMSLFPQASRQALFGGGVQPQYVMAAAQPQYYFEQVTPAPQQQLNDLSLNGRYDAAYQQQQDQQQQQENNLLLRQQLLSGGGVQTTTTAQTLQDPAYANILLQLRLQEEERLRHQAAAMGLGGGSGRW